MKDGIPTGRCLPSADTEERRLRQHHNLLMRREMQIFFVIGGIMLHLCPLKTRSIGRSIQNGEFIISILWNVKTSFRALNQGKYLKTRKNKMLIK